MNRIKLVPVVVVAAVGLVLAGGAAVMAESSSGDKGTSKVEASKPTPKLKSDPKPGAGAHSFGQFGGQGLNAEALAAQIDKMPEAMRTDIAEVLTAPKAERAKLIEAVIAKAKSGGYGEELKNQIVQGEKKSREFGKRAKKEWDELPDALKNDLKAVRELDKDQRADAMRKIAEDAKAGKYGEDVKKKFEKFQNFDRKQFQGHGGTKVDDLT